tara:strand:- start:1785 stop:3734 length:1950 start_codon:yes stop_codon:yes gene_type:complete
MGIFNGFRDKIDPRNYRVMGKGDVDDMSKDYHSMMKRTNDEFLHANSRASTPYPFMDTPDGSKIPMFRVAPNRMFELADYVGDLRAVIETIQREMFRNGLEVIPRYKHKCLVCLKEYTETPLEKYVKLDEMNTADKQKLRCTSCDNNNPTKWSKPDPQNRQILQTLLDKRVNNNQQSLKLVARQAERDLDIIDGFYVLVTRKWAIKEIAPDPVTGATRRAVDSIKISKLDEIIRVHPIQCSIIANDEAVLGVGADGKPRYVCPDYEHRDTVIEVPVCPKCGCEAFNAFLETNSVPYGVPLSSPKKMYYSQKEVIWCPGKYMPDVLYGNSPIQSVWKKVMSLMFQDEYMWKYFDKDRPPKSLLAIGSRNGESVTQFMEKQRQGARQDPYMPRPILLNTENVSQSLQYIDLTPNFKELELNELRKELRQIISTVYGVQPLFYGEPSTSGLGNESLQVTLTNRTIKWFQRFFNENFFNEITDLMEIYDWGIELVTSEEIDALRDEQVRGQKIDNAVKMYGMGFDVSMDGENEIQISQYPNPEKVEMMMNPGGQEGGGGNPENAGKSKSSSPKKEGEAQSFDGQPKTTRPSDIGGTGGGSPASGAGTSLSNKSEGMSQDQWDQFIKAIPKMEAQKKRYTVKKAGRPDVVIEED